MLFFAGGYSEDGLSARVDIYNVNTGNWEPTQGLSQGRYGLASAAIGDYVVFGGGFGKNGASDVVDIYNVRTKQWTTAKLSVARKYLVAAAAGNKLLFAGGQEKNIRGASSVGDIFELK